MNTYDSLISEFKYSSRHKRKLRALREIDITNDCSLPLKIGQLNSKPSVNLNKTFVFPNESIDDFIESKANLQSTLELEDAWNHKYVNRNSQFHSTTNQSVITNLKEFELKQRIILNYFGNRKISSIPGLHKEDVQLTKLQNIAKLKDTEIKEKANYFYDTCCCLEQRKVIYKIRKRVSSACNNIVRNIIFDNLILIVILVNTAFILVSNPNAINLQDATDVYFLSIYTVEMILKVFALGFVKNENSYLRDNWNILDFLVVIIGWISYVLTEVFGNSGFKQIGVLRTVRTLRPLKSIKSIAGLRVIMEALFGSISGIKDTVIVIIFFFLIFAVGGMQMWQGNLLMRCVNTETGAALSYDSYKTACTSNDDCQDFVSSYETFLCLKVGKNPYYDALSFDNIQKSMMLVLVITTMEGWSEYYNYYRRTFKDNYYVNEIILITYFTLLLFIGGYYLINLFLAVINETYRKVDDKMKEDSRPKEKRLIDLLSIERLKKTSIREESSEELLNKLREEFCFITKDTTNLKIDYQILKDLALLKSNTAEDLYYLKLSLEAEGRKIKSEFGFEKKALKKSMTIMTAKIESDRKSDTTKDQLIRQDETLKYSSKIYLDPTRKCSQVDINRLEACIRRTTFTFLHFFNSKRKDFVMNSQPNLSGGETIETHTDSSKSDILSSKGNLDYNEIVDQEIELKKRNLSVLNFTEIHNMHEADESFSEGSLSKNQISPLIKHCQPLFEDIQSLSDSIDLSFPDNINESLEVGRSQISNECEVHVEDHETCLSKVTIQDTQIPFFHQLSKPQHMPLANRTSRAKLRFSFPLKVNQVKQKKRHILSFIPEYNQVNFDRLNRKLSIEHNENLSSARLISDNPIGLLKHNSIYRRSNSIKKLMLKYPASDSINVIYRDDEKNASSSSLINQNNKIKQQFQSYRENGAYIYNLLHLNFEVQDKFKIQTHHEIFDNSGPYKLSEKEQEAHLKHSNSNVFDSSNKYKSHIKQSFLPYRKIILSDKDIVHYNHALRSLPAKTFNSIPIHNLISKKVIIEDTKKEDLKQKLIQKAKSTRTRRSSFSLSNCNTLMKLCNFTNSMKSINTSITSTRSNKRKDRIEVDNYAVLDKDKFNLISKKFLLESKLSKSRKPKEKEERTQTINIKKEIGYIHRFDKESSFKKNIIWSNQDILKYEDDHRQYDAWNSQMDDLENLKVRLWNKKPIIKQVEMLKFVFFRISMSQYFDLFILFVVLINAFFMALDGNLLLPDEFNNLEFSKYIFNSIFIFEFTVKIIGIGPVLYFSEFFSYLDIIIFIFALIDVFTLEDDQSKISQLSFLRVLRIFRVLRLLKVLRKIKSVRKIVYGIAKTISSIYYILLILLIFIFIFQLIGMTLFSGDNSYSSFINGFYTTFQLLTLENWNNNIVELNLISQWAALYLILWVFIGNFVLFNLFLSILLESFIEEPYSGMRFPLEYPETFKAIELMEAEYKIKLKKQKQKIGDEEYELSDECSEPEEFEIVNYTIITEKVLKRLFADNQCEYSLYLFSQKGTIRGQLYTIINSKAFDKIILAIISLSTIDLIAESFITSESETVSIVLDSFDLVFNVIFIVEAVLKIISMGFVMEKGTYLRDNWNKLDFLIVVVSFFDIEQICYKWSYADSIQSSLGYLKVLRILRILRPLRFISHNKQLKLTINCLVDSIQAIVSVVLIVMVVFFIMSIVGITLFSNEIDQNCSSSSNFLELMADQGITQILNPTLYQNKCFSQNGSVDIIPLFKFSNIFESMITSYVLSSLEGWPDIMSSYTYYDQIYGLFFIFYLIIVSYFFMNLFVGVMFSTYNDAIQKEKKKGIQNNWKAQRYLDLLFLLDTAKPDYITFRKKTGAFSQWASKIISTGIFENFIIFIIVLNMITLAIDYEGSEDQYSNVILKLNYFFTSIFILECILKLVANSPRGYFNNTWNRFDFFVVIASIFDVVITNFFIDTNIKFLKSFQIFRILRVLRVTRVLRLFKTLKGLEKILQTIYWSMKALGNVLLLLFLVIFIFAVLGSNIVTFFYQDYSNSFTYYDQYFNFNNFYTGMLLVLRSITGENWPNVMKELANVFDLIGLEPTVIYFFMISLNFFLTVIMINLLLLVVLEQYDELNAKEENPIIKFNDILISFNTAWNSFSTEQEKGYTIKASKLKDLIEALRQSKFQFQPTDTLDSMCKLILECRFIVDSEGKVFYYDVLYKILKLEYGIQQKRIKVVSMEEHKISKFILNKMKSTLKKIDPKNYNARKDQLSIFNPMPSHHIFRTSFLYASQIIKNYQQSKGKPLPPRQENQNECADDSDI